MSRKAKSFIIILYLVIKEHIPMAGSSFGNIFKITTWGESHGKALGAVIDGCPAGLPLCEEDIQKFLDRRKPGQSRYTTARKEGDLVEILSGVFEGKTTGTPISLMVRNTDQRSRDYGNIAYSYRPGHADYTFDQKYGFRDYRGGGRSSGRETIGRVAAGAIASKILEELGISICTYTRSIGPVEIASFNKEEIKILMDEICTDFVLRENINTEIPDMTFYNHGFKYFEFEDSDEHLNETSFNYINFFNTPEKIILYISKKAKVIGISATGSINTATGNYDLDYLRHKLRDDFKSIPVEVYK